MQKHNTFKLLTIITLIIITGCSGGSNKGDEKVTAMAQKVKQGLDEYARDSNGIYPRELDAMVEADVDAIVFSSTAAVYGEPESVPILETSAKRPINAYGASKLMFEQMLSWYESIHSMRSIRLRYFNVAGAWPDGSMGEAHDPETHIVPRLLKAVAGGRAELYLCVAADSIRPRILKERR